MQADFLPITFEEMQTRGWDAPDFIFVTGDAYVDHPSFGAALLSRVLEAEGYRVAILPQPNWKNTKDFMRFGKPKLAFLVSAGVIDSMVNHYTAAKKIRSEDVYSPGGQRGHRPDRASIVYCNKIREAYHDVPIVIGGVEASLRRFAHYDYWENKVRKSILLDSGADVLIYGMGEKPLVAIAEHLQNGTMKESLPAIDGVCFVCSEKPGGYEEIPSYEEVSQDTQAYAKAFMTQYLEQDPIRGKKLVQAHEGHWLCQNKPAKPLSRAALDHVYELPFLRRWHPAYDAAGGVPALEEVQFSITGTRGCFGSCSFCSLTFLQGRIVTSRSQESILKEAKLLTELPTFKGYIHDIGGPTANFRKPACAKQQKSGTCKHRQCMYPTLCKEIRPDHEEYLKVLRSVRALPGVKKVFVRSGLRYDYILADKKTDFLKELSQYHISGRLKVAPEHVSGQVLAMMGKPSRDVYNRFIQKFYAINEQLGQKQFVQPYLMSSHPGCNMLAAVELAEYLRDTNEQPEQVQDFYPTPGTLSTCMFYTGLDPRTMQPVYVPTSAHEKALQRALLQYKKPQNRPLVREALKLAGRDDLIGYGKKCLVHPEPVQTNHESKPKAKPQSTKPKKDVRKRPPRNTVEGRLGTKSPKALFAQKEKSK